ncbi:MAG: hypothetical protein RR477_07995 [Raoultibacter sp.]
MNIGLKDNWWLFDYRSALTDELFASSLMPNWDYVGFCCGRKDKIIIPYLQNIFSESFMHTPPQVNRADSRVDP